MCVWLAHLVSEWAVSGVCVCVCAAHLMSGQLVSVCVWLAHLVSGWVVSGVCVCVAVSVHTGYNYNYM